MASIYYSLIQWFVLSKTRKFHYLILTLYQINSKEIIRAYASFKAKILQLTNQINNVSLFNSAIVNHICWIILRIVVNHKDGWVGCIVNCRIVLKVSL